MTWNDLGEILLIINSTLESIVYTGCTNKRKIINNVIDENRKENFITFFL